MTLLDLDQIEQTARAVIEARAAMDAIPKGKGFYSQFQAARILWEEAQTALELNADAAELLALCALARKGLEK